MPVGSHIHQLELRHRELEDKLTEILASPSADDMEIADIKRQKLYIKDKIHQLKESTQVH